jgi:hypothetical protein
LLLFALYLHLVKREQSNVFIPENKQITTSPASAISKNEWQKTRAYKPSDGTLVLK